MAKIIALSLTTALFTCLAIQSVTASSYATETSKEITLSQDTAGF